MVGEDVLYLTVRELGKQIRNKQLSPVELTESYLARSEKYDSQLHAYVTLTRDLAMRQARAAEDEINRGHYRGPLHGIPYAAKDLLAVRGYKTTWGARPFRDQTFDYNAAVIEKLNAGGAVLIGKAAMIELAGGLGYRYASASVTGATRNPWNRSCWTGGSSSGSGAITAAGLAAFAIGTETWGSIICPSAFCGLSGLRPTFGRVSRYGAMALAYSLDKIGPLARSADDCALILSVIAGHDRRDASSLPPVEAKFTYESAVTGSTGSGTKEHSSAWSAAPAMKIGWVANAWEKPDAQVQSTARSAVELLQRYGCTLTEISLPASPCEAAAGTIVSVEAAAAFRKFIESGRAIELADSLGRVGGYVNAELRASDYMTALQIRGVFQKRIDALFDDIDVIAAPSLPVPATTVETNLEAELSFPDAIGGTGNLCGLPAISIPCGFTMANLPVGVQFLARARNEHAIIGVANLFQQHTDWHKQRPPLA